MPLAKRHDTLTHALQFACRPGDLDPARGVYFVRNRLFPDYVWFRPRKVDNRYAFVDHA